MHDAAPEHRGAATSEILTSFPQIKKTVGADQESQCSCMTQSQHRETTEFSIHHWRIV